MSDRFTRRIYRDLASGRDLSAEEEAHLGSCARCRSAADRARRFEQELDREMAELRAPMPANPLSVTEASRRPMRWAPILALGLVLAVGATVAGVAVLPPPAPVSEASPSAASSAPPASASAVPSRPAPSPAVEPSPTSPPTPSPTPRPSPRPGDYAIAPNSTVDLYDRPGGDSFTELQVGADILVLDVNGDWYEVQALSSESFDYVFGWVIATGALERHEPLPCRPIEPEAHNWLGSGHPQQDVDCYGDLGELTVRGYAVDATGRAAVSAYAGNPAWLAGPSELELSSVIGSAATGFSVFLHLPPELEGTIPISDRDGLVGTLLDVTGHFNDPRSTECSLTPALAEHPPVEDRNAELWCRQRFVVDRVEVVDSGS